MPYNIDKFTKVQRASSRYGQEIIRKELSFIMSHLPKEIGITWRGRFFLDQESIDLFSKTIDAKACRRFTTANIYLTLPNMLQAMKWEPRMAANRSLADLDEFDMKNIEEKRRAIKDINSFIEYGTEHINGVLRSVSIPTMEELFEEGLNFAIGYNPNPMRIGKMVCEDPNVKWVLGEIFGTGRFAAFYVKIDNQMVKLRPWETWVVVSAMKHKAAKTGYSWQPADKGLLTWAMEDLVYAEELDGKVVRLEAVIAKSDITLPTEIPPLITITKRDNVKVSKIHTMPATSFPMYAPLKMDRLRIRNYVYYSWRSRLFARKRMKIADIYERFFVHKAPAEIEARGWEKKMLHIDKSGLAVKNLDKKTYI